MSEKVAMFYKYFCVVMIGVNVFCALTEGGYYLMNKTSRFFNVAAVIWLLAMLANMAMTLGANKNPLLRFVTLALPVILTVAIGTIPNSTTSSAGARGIQVMAFLYYLYSAFYSYVMIDTKHFPMREVKKPGVGTVIGLVLFLLFYLIIMIVYQIYVTHEVYISELSMSSIVSFLSQGTLFLPVFGWSVSIGLIRRFMYMNRPMLSIAVALIMVIAFTTAMTPFFAMPSALKNANNSYLRTYGDSKDTIAISVPEMIFGGTESGYKVTNDVKWTTYTYTSEDGKTSDHDLTYDMYKSSKETTATPILIRFHGSGSTKGTRNLVLMSEAIASEGYTVFDVNYGNEEVKPTNDELTENICGFINYLYENREELNIDVDNIFLSGVSRGGKMAYKASACWANNTYLDLKNKVTIRGAIICWGFMNDVFTREGAERIVSEDELTSELPDILFIDTTNDGSVQGGLYMEGFLHSVGAKAANIELKYAMHSANSYYYGPWGQMTDEYILRFMRDMVK